MRNDALWTLLLLSWMTGATYYYVCHIRKHCCGGCEGISDMSMAELTATPVGRATGAGRRGNHCQ